MRSFTIILILAMTPAVWAQGLTGTKTVGGTSPNYSTLVAAAAALNSAGVGPGGVTFHIRSGTYSGQVILTVSGTAANPVVFRRDPTLSSSASITVTASGADSVFKLDGADWVTLDGVLANRFTIRAPNQDGVKLLASASNNTIRNCTILQPHTDLLTHAGIVAEGAVVGTTLDGNVFVVSSSSDLAHCKGMLLPPGSTITRNNVSGTGRGADD